MRQGAAGSNLGGCLSRFARARDGVSAIEFALILPFMLTLYLGGSELGDGMAVQFKVTLAARTVADLASQCGNGTLDGQYCDTANGLPIDNTSMNQIIGATTQVMTPYSAANMVVTVSELKFTGGSTNASVVWSASNSGSGRTIGSSYTLPAAYQQLPQQAGNAPYYVISRRGHLSLYPDHGIRAHRHYQHLRGCDLFSAQFGSAGLRAVQYRAE